MERQPKVSVLIPTYNYARYLDEAIQSVLDQTFQDFELIIVDNHSTDNTDEVVKKYLSDPRISYHVNASNLGLTGNWNQCLVYVKTEYIKFICADDKIHPEMLAKYYAVMEENPNVSLVTCYKQLFGGQPWLVDLPLQNLQNGKKVIYDTMMTKSWIGEPTSVMFRTKNLKYGNFRKDLTGHVDWELWNRQLAIGDCYIFPEALAFVRAHASQHTMEVSRLACFEEYHMANLLHTYPGFDTEADNIKIKSIIKDKAALCAKKAMYKELPNILKKKNRSRLLQALKITWKENAFIDGFLLLWKGLRAKTRTHYAAR